MNFPREIGELNYRLIERTLTHELASYLKSAGKKKAVVGLSGGLDSAVVAALSKNAIGKKNVICPIIPSGSAAEKDVEDARLVAKMLGVRKMELPIDSLVSSLESAIGSGRPGRKRTLLEKGNIAARARMIILHDIAARNDALVVGTGDKSEILIGYFTKYGDGGVDVLPIGDLYKTQVRLLAKHLNLPKRIYSKPSSPNLWKNQTAEGELGMSYEEIDSFLWAFFEKRSPEKEISEKYGMSRGLCAKILKMARSSAHKRRMPAILKTGARSN